MLLSTVLLALTWCVLTREPTLPNFVLGLGLGWFFSKASGVRGPRIDRVLRRAPRAFLLSIYFMLRLVEANVRIAILVVGPRRWLRPSIVAVAVDTRSEAEIATLSNLVTLTPGTLTIDVSPNGRTFYIHCMSPAVPGKCVEDVQQGFSRRVRRVFE